MKTSEHSDEEQGNHHMSRREMEERLANGPANDYMKLAATAKQLAEWLEWTNRARFKPCSTCPSRWPNGCVDDWETCEVESAKGVAWLEDKDDD